MVKKLLITLLSVWFSAQGMNHLAGLARYARPLISQFTSLNALNGIAFLLNPHHLPNMLDTAKHAQGSHEKLVHHFFNKIPGGNLALTAAPNNPVAYWGPLQYGIFNAACLKGLTPKDATNKIVDSLSLNEFKAYDERLKTTVFTLELQIEETKNKLLRAQTPKEQEDLKKLLGRLGAQLASIKKYAAKLNGSKELILGKTPDIVKAMKNCKDDASAIVSAAAMMKEPTIEGLKKYEKGLEAGLGSHIYTNQRDSQLDTLFGIIEQRNKKIPLAITKQCTFSGISFPDCGETSLVNFIRQFITNDQKEIDQNTLNTISQLTPLNPKMVEFFKTYNDKNLYDSQEYHHAWAQVCANLQGVSYRTQKTHEIDAGLQNMTIVIAQLFGINPSLSPQETFDRLAELLQKANITLQHNIPATPKTPFGTYNFSVEIQEKKRSFSWKFTESHFGLEYPVDNSPKDFFEDYINTTPITSATHFHALIAIAPETPWFRLKDTVYKNQGTPGLPAIAFYSSDSANRPFLVDAILSNPKHRLYAIAQELFKKLSIENQIECTDFIENLPAELLKLTLQNILKSDSEKFKSQVSTGEISTSSIIQKSVESNDKEVKDLGLQVAKMSNHFNIAWALKYLNFCSKDLMLIWLEHLKNMESHKRVELINEDIDALIHALTSSEPEVRNLSAEIINTLSTLEQWIKIRLDQLKEHEKNAYELKIKAAFISNGNEKLRISVLNNLKKEKHTDLLFGIYSLILDYNVSTEIFDSCFEELTKTVKTSSADECEFLIKIYKKQASPSLNKLIEATIQKCLKRAPQRIAYLILEAEIKPFYHYAKTAFSKLDQKVHDGFKKRFGETMIQELLAA